ncbi:RTA1 like protein-domain-containing protein [Aspergillus cavernicola]|uniref:RTA1 like protein-domain-containing protein n=1 Tax=Aspergillus cavernicola TaxID=176166 RepID=A0ABR4HV03_9EURO
MMTEMPTNETLIENTELCTLETCPLSLGMVHYLPLLWCQILFMGIFGAAVIPQLGFGIRYKTWTFMVAMVLGLIGEVVGYGGRIMLNNNPFKLDGFLMYLVSLTISPAFFTAAVYLTLSRIVVAYGEKISYFKPRTYTITFITFDFIALILQAAGGAMASTAEPGDQAATDLGVNVMIAGVAWQVVSLGIFTVMATYFYLRVRKAASTDFNPDFAVLRSTRYFKASLWGFGFATLAIFVRSVYRCAELSDGFDGALANDEVTFMILEAAMIASAVITLTVFHPGSVWKGQWNEAVWSTRGKGEQEYRKTSSMDSDIALHPMRMQQPSTSYEPYNPQA